MENLQGQASIRQRIGRINDMFISLNIQQNDITHKKREQPVLPTNNFNSRGEVMLSPKEVRQNYEKAWFGFKWYQMPFCRRSIKRKVYFWAPASLGLTLTYAQYLKKKDPTGNIKLPAKFYLQTFFALFAVASCISIAQSLLFEQFCDIQSPFYQESQTRLSIAKRIRGQMKDKDGGFISSFFT